MPNKALSSEDALASLTSTQTQSPLRALLQSRELPMAEQRALELDPGGGSFRLRAPNGSIELSVRITPAGPVLTFASAAIEVVETRELKIEVERFAVRARDVQLECAGDLKQTIAGDSVTHCAGRHELQAGAVSIISHDDAMALDSTHDLVINGDRVLINC